MWRPLRLGFFFAFCQCFIGDCHNLNAWFDVLGIINMKYCLQVKPHGTVFRSWQSLDSQRGPSVKKVASNWLHSFPVVHSQHLSPHEHCTCSVHHTCICTLSLRCRAFCKKNSAWKKERKKGQKRVAHTQNVCNMQLRELELCVRLSGCIRLTVPLLSKSQITLLFHHHFNVLNFRRCLLAEMRGISPRRRGVSNFFSI